METVEQSTYSIQSQGKDNVQPYFRKLARGYHFLHVFLYYHRNYFH